LIAGGILTQYASWRWCLLVNIPISIVAAAAAYRLIGESRTHARSRYDLPGAFLSTLGMVGLVYGFTEASSHGWTAPLTLAILAISVAFIVAFVVVEARSSNPLLPLRVVMDRNRGGSYLATLFVGMGLMGAFLFLTFYMQQTLHYSALRTGFSYLPFSLGVIVGAALATQAVSRFSPRVVMGTGLGLAIVGMLSFAQIGLHTSYWAHIMPAELILSLGLGLVFVPVSNVALVGVGADDSGVASALVNATQQVGGSIGTALLNTIATTVMATYIRQHGPGPLSAANGALHGYAVAFTAGAGFLVLALIAVWSLVTVKRAGSSAPDSESDGEEMVLVPAAA
jgi:MFS family permease